MVSTNKDVIIGENPAYPGVFGTLHVSSDQSLGRPTRSLILATSSRPRRCSSAARIFLCSRRNRDAAPPSATSTVRTPFSNRTGRDRSLHGLATISRQDVLITSKAARRPSVTRSRTVSSVASKAFKPRSGSSPVHGFFMGRSLSSADSFHVRAPSSTRHRLPIWGTSSSRALVTKTCPPGSNSVTPPARPGSNSEKTSSRSRIGGRPCRCLSN